MIDAILIAGGVPAPEDSLYPATQGGHKAMLDIAGKSMAQWVMDAIGAASQVRSVVVVGLEAGVRLDCAKPVSYLPDGADMLTNIQSGLHAIRESDPAADYVLIASADIPAITPEMVDWRVEKALQAGAELDYTVVAREVMERRFPGSHRSYVRLRDVEVCGGDINVVRAHVIEKRELWRRMIAARKNAFKQAALVGWDILFLLLTRRMTLQEAEFRVSRRLGLIGHATLAPYAEMAMDVDKLDQLALIRADLGKSA